MYVKNRPGILYDFFYKQPVPVLSYNVGLFENGLVFNLE